jgi:hypothetical protein
MAVTVLNRRLGTLEDVAADLGIAPSTLAERCRRGLFPCVKLPGARRVMIPLDDAELYVATGCALEVKRLADGGRLVTPAKRRGS